MSRTRLRQVEQIINSETYDDQKTMANAESNPGTLNIEEDLNFIRTQLRILNDPTNGGTTNWYDEPVGTALNAYFNATSTPSLSGDAIDVGGNYDAGEPYELNVYLNGQLLMPSLITGTTITTQRDYQEIDEDGNNVSTGSTGRKIRPNIDIVSGDVLQFTWTRKG